MASTLKINNLDTASGTTITLPTGKTLVGTDEGAFRVPGAVLQVVQVATTTTTSTSSTSFVDTGMVATITPKSSSSKILVTADFGVGAGNSSNGAIMQLVRGSTQLFYRGNAYSGAGNSYGVDAFFHLDSPATTSATTYKVQIASQGSSTTCYANPEYSGFTDPTAHITLIEIAG